MVDRGDSLTDYSLRIHTFLISQTRKYLFYNFGQAIERVYFPLSLLGGNT